MANTIDFKAPLSESPEDVAKFLFKDGFVAQVARISYNPVARLPTSECTKNLYPLIIEGTYRSLSANFGFHSVTAGHNGTESQAMVAVLKTAGFNFDENDILTNRLADADGTINFVLER